MTSDSAREIASLTLREALIAEIRHASQHLTEVSELADLQEFEIHFRTPGGLLRGRRQIEEMKREFLESDRRWLDDAFIGEMVALAKQVSGLEPLEDALLATRHSLGPFYLPLFGGSYVFEEAGGREGGAHDRLFDVLMRRFDALRPYREALGNILCAEAGDPASALCGLCRLKRSMACMLEAAMLSPTGLRGALRVKALGLAYLATLRVFLRDESPDMATTMAALDRNLARLERLARLCSRTRYRPDGASQET